MVAHGCPTRREGGSEHPSSFLQPFTPQQLFCPSLFFTALLRYNSHSIKFTHLALTSVARLVGRRPAKRKVICLIPGQGTCPGCRFSPPSGCIQEATNQCFSPFLSPSLLLSLKINCFLKVHPFKAYNSMNFRKYRELCIHTHNQGFVTSSTTQISSCPFAVCLQPRGTTGVISVAGVLLFLELHVDKVRQHVVSGAWLSLPGIMLLRFSHAATHTSTRFLSISTWCSTTWLDCSLFDIPLLKDLGARSVSFWTL